MRRGPIDHTIATAAARQQPPRPRARSTAEKVRCRPRRERRPHLRAIHFRRVHEIARVLPAFVRVSRQALRYHTGRAPAAGQWPPAAAAWIHREWRQRSPAADVPANARRPVAISNSSGAERKDVGPPVDGSAFKLFRRHVGHRADERAFDGGLHRRELIAYRSRLRSAGVWRRRSPEA